MKGMTWDHPRGSDPLIAASRRWQALGGSDISWDRRSLQDFENWPIAELARRFDLLVIDHPHVGVVAEQGMLAPFAALPGAAVDADLPLQSIRQGSVGASYDSYAWEGRQWALPIDAAAQVMAWVPALLPQPPGDWDAILVLAHEGRVALPMRAPHALMSLMTLCGLCGVWLDPAATPLFPPEAGQAWEMLRALWLACGNASSRHDPIAVLEEMAAAESRIALAPLIYGYVSYAAAGFRPRRLAFVDLVPVVGGDPSGSVLGGTGIAVSALSPHRDEAVRFARWLASGEVQREVVARFGGQPAHDAAWSDTGINLASGGFYRMTRRTLDRAWVRPRGAGYIGRQNAVSALIIDLLETRRLPADALKLLNRLLDSRSTGSPVK